MLTVATVLSNPQPGQPKIYDTSHVERLREQVTAHLDQPFEFVCVDDSPWLGWWAKISLFEPGLFKGRVLYLDLDVTVTGALDAVAGYMLDDLALWPAPFCSIKDWQTHELNSSVMVWHASDWTEAIWKTFVPSADINTYNGDQNYIRAILMETQTFPPGWICSYKHQKRWNYWPPDMKVCVFHGRPKPWEIEGEPWK